MLQITAYNISLQLGLRKKARALITTERAWASANGQNGHSPSFWKLGLRTKNY